MFLILCVSVCVLLQYRCMCWCLALMQVVLWFVALCVRSALRLFGTEPSRAALLADMLWRQLVPN